MSLTPNILQLPPSRLRLILQNKQSLLRVVDNITEETFFEQNQKFLQSIGQLLYYQDIYEEIRNNNKVCPICSDNFQNYTEILITSCFHLFCRNCIEKWLIKEQKKKCPLCRNTIVEN